MTLRIIKITPNQIAFDERQHHPQGLGITSLGNLAACLRWAAASCIFSVVELEAQAGSRRYSLVDYSNAPVLADLKRTGGGDIPVNAWVVPPLRRDDRDVTRAMFSLIQACGAAPDKTARISQALRDIEELQHYLGSPISSTPSGIARCLKVSDGMVRKVLEINEASANDDDADAGPAMSAEVTSASEPRKTPGNDMAIAQDSPVNPAAIQCEGDGHDNE